MKKAAKSWDFKIRGGIHSVNQREIAETLSRKNPVAVVTMIPNVNSRRDKAVLIIVHHTVHQKCKEVFDCHVSEYLKNNIMGHGRLHIADYDLFTSIQCIGTEAMGMVSTVLENLSQIRQADLLDRTEYIAAVNYPAI